MAAILLFGAAATESLVPAIKCSRRSLGLAPALALLPARDAAAASFGMMSARLDAPLLQEPDISPTVDATASLPAWLIGRWQCTQTLQAFSTPLGLRFIGAPGQPIDEAEATAAQTRAQIGKPVTLELRFKADGKGGAVEDRAFNAQSRLDAFAGRKVVRSAEACEAEASRIRDGRSASDVRARRLIACTIVDFKGGGATQKVLVNAFSVARRPLDGGASDGGERAVASEVTRSIFARTLMPGDTRSFPPITVDSETILEVQGTGEASPMEVTGRLRLVDYLQPLDAMYFEAARRSVAVSDYTIHLSRLP